MQICKPRDAYRDDEREIKASDRGWGAMAKSPKFGRSWDTKEAIVFTGRDLPGYKNWTPSAPLDQGNWPDAKV
uniref:Uncharacterized protein n=1 Tax=Oryza meridionalis TaxID=40149 RepID=A0A0E0CNL5_9ORYZ